MKVSTDVQFNHNNSGKGVKNTPPHNKANAFEKTCTVSRLDNHCAYLKDMASSEPRQVEGCVLRERTRMVREIKLLVVGAAGAIGAAAVAVSAGAVSAATGTIAGTATAATLVGLCNIPALSNALPKSYLGGAAAVGGDAAFVAGAASVVAGGAAVAAAVAGGATTTAGGAGVALGVGLSIAIIGVGSTLAAAVIAGTGMGDARAVLSNNNMV